MTTTFLVEVPEVYDGWIFEYDQSTDEIRWRDHYVTNRMSAERKQELEIKFKEGLKDVK